MLKLKELCIVESKDALRGVPEGKVLINTMWRSYVIGNPLFLWNIMKEKMT